MTQIKKNFGWIFGTIVGSAIFSLGFDLFLLPNDLNTGGISGLAMVLVHLLKIGSVGMLSFLINLPLFCVGGLKVGKRFFIGSIIGMVVSSVLLDVFLVIPVPQTEPLLGAVYGGAICGLGLGIDFVAGTSTGGSDIVVRLLKLRYRNIPIGQITIAFDLVVALLTGIVFGDITKTLYSGVAVFICGKVIDAVVYRFDYSKIALVVSREYEQIAKEITIKLDRGVTFLHGQGYYSRRDTEVILTAVKKQQLAELKELVTEIDPDAFIIVQEAHQVMGEGFSRYSKDSL